MAFAPGGQIGHDRLTRPPSDAFGEAAISLVTGRDSAARAQCAANQPPEWNTPVRASLAVRCVRMALSCSAGRAEQLGRARP
jgi:hypothetical protein